MDNFRPLEMPWWYYDKKELRNTPSIRDGIDYDTECRYRREGARLIIDTGTKMELGYNTLATAVVFFHRFYMHHSFRQFPRYVTACCCLFLAGKVEETPKKCLDIIAVAKCFLTDQKFQTFGADPREEVMTLERILLQTIQFDLQVEHPYRYLLKYINCFKGEKAKLQKMVQMAWTFVNDSLCTTLCLQWEPEIIAVALMHLASKLSQFEVVDWYGKTSKHYRWWDLYVKDITMELLEDICHQVLDLYSQPRGSCTPDSPPLTASGRLAPGKKVKTPTKGESHVLKDENAQDKDFSRKYMMKSYPSYLGTSISTASSSMSLGTSSVPPTGGPPYTSYLPSHQYSSSHYQNASSTRQYHSASASSGKSW